mmetsp:Transcript_27211/g.49750  ORF Transcript_27211/g.49750 Transcript_27211/m.49750 type:complete len:87 (-) Transcript_27211:205-465(-)
MGTALQRRDQQWLQRRGNSRRRPYGGDLLRRAARTGMLSGRAQGADRAWAALTHAILAPLKRDDGAGAAQATPLRGVPAVPTPTLL